MEKTGVPRFVKWAGGKLQLLDQFEPLFPNEFERYFEPFVGSGAVAFYIIKKYKPKQVFLSDTNEELVSSYNAIKYNLNELITLLKQHKDSHEQKGKEYYYQVRSLRPSNPTEMAARFIYLNKTCFNGLYRVNSSNGFNVPMGEYKNPDIVQDEKIAEISKILQNVEIKTKSFESVLNKARGNDFVYMDPPYHPLKKESFTTYTKDNFQEEDQVKLANVFKELSDKGCLVMESNSDTEFIRNLYNGFKIDTVRARRVINSKGDGRGKINELVIRNY